MGWGILAMSQAEPERAFLMRQIVQRLVSQKAVAGVLGGKYRGFGPTLAS